MTMRRYETYKPSDVEWLGEVPSYWQVKPLLAVAVESDRSNKGMLENNLLSLSYGSIIQKDINENDGLLPESFETYQIVEPDDIVWRLTDLQNDKRSLRTSIVSERGIITSAYLATTPLAVDARYFHHLLRAYDYEKVFYSMGGGLRQSMKFSDVKRLPVLLPPPAEQRAIAAFLDRETAKIDALVEEQRRLIDLLKEKRQALISHAVTKGLDPAAPMKDSGIEWLGDVPAHWEAVRIKDVCEEIVDCKNRTPEPREDGTYFVVRTSCVRDGAFDFAGGYLTDLESFVEWTRKGTPQAGDILFTREAPTGEACLVPADVQMCLGQRMMYLRPNKSQLNSEYLLHSIYGPLVRQFIDSKSKGSTVGHLRVGEIGELPILLPPLAEQLIVVMQLSKRLGQMDVLNAEAESAIALLQERRAALISAAVTGKIDVRDLVPAEQDAA
jgi:type I restriction enzyme S subunit